VVDRVVDMAITADAAAGARAVFGTGAGVQWAEQEAVMIYHFNTIKIDSMLVQ